jgi:2,4-dienoyl-CoA reductase-like NADH-dependent reductase (Old Yellow Enzyme family)
MKNQLFSEIKIREITFRNRLFVSPMCQYSAYEGVPNEWHFVHLGSRATGGAALVIAEATAVTPEGRISYADLGIWNDHQMEELKKITDFIKSQGARAGIQLAHAGRKASTDKPWNEAGYLPKSKGGWDVVAPSPISFSDSSPEPRELSSQEILDLVEAFKAATQRSLEAGFEVIEIHMAHGYLLHQFLSPLSNKREDEYGGSLENRMRFPLMVAQAVREVMPERFPLFVRISATDWKEDGWDLEQSIILCEELKKLGTDLIDVSSGGSVPKVKIPVAPLYQVPFAEEIKKRVDIRTGAVGLITEAKEAEEIITSHKADVVLLARELLRDPYWPIKAAIELGADAPIPNQYLRAF